MLYIADFKVKRMHAHSPGPSTAHKRTGLLPEEKTIRECTVRASEHPNGQ